MAQHIIMQTTPYDGPQTLVTVLWVSSRSLHVADLNVCLLLGLLIIWGCYVCISRVLYAQPRAQPDSNSGWPVIDNWAVVG